MFCTICTVYFFQSRSVDSLLVHCNILLFSSINSLQPLVRHFAASHDSLASHSASHDSLAPHSAASHDSLVLHKVLVIYFAIQVNLRS